MAAAELITELARLEELAAEWDELAVACSAPLMSPGWLLAWWRHVAPEGAEPRFVAVREGARLVGLAPFFVQPRGWAARVDYRLPGIELAVRLTPLALPDREWEVAHAVAGALAAARPRPDLVALEGSPLASHWLAALRAGWPGPIRPFARTYHLQACPTVLLEDDSLDGWLAHKSQHARRRIRRARKLFLEAGGSVRMSTLQTLEADVDVLLGLHAARWQERSGSNLVALGERFRAMLLDAGGALLEQGRFRLWTLEIEGAPIAAHVAIAAGGEMLGINGGWDSSYHRMSPTTVSVLYQIEEAIARGERRIDLGLGEQSFKTSIADGNDPVAWSVLIPPGPRFALTLLRTAPMLCVEALRNAAKRALPARYADRLRRLRDSARAGGEQEP